MAQLKPVTPTQVASGWPNSVVPTGPINVARLLGGPTPDLNTPTTTGLGGWPWTQSPGFRSPGGRTAPPGLTDHPVTPPMSNLVPQNTQYFQLPMPSEQVRAAITAWNGQTAAWREGLRRNLLSWRRGGN
jgi:hypothetical protein